MLELGRSESSADQRAAAVAGAAKSKEPHVTRDQPKRALSGISVAHPQCQIMSDFPSNVYACNLLSHRGYPLWTPEPNIELPDSYQREGLKIGDVGVVVPDDGSFDVFFNMTLPREHPLHAPDGVPSNFSQ
ncbi:hypothetical protein L210DRAFT_2779864, partial [Boletus edulis BED1]